MSPKKKKVIWSDADDRILIKTLHKAKVDGFQSDSGWKPQVWALCVEALKDSAGPPKTGEKIQDHYGTLKAIFLIVKHLRDASGFGWDDGLKMVTARDDVWDTYLAKHPKAKRWRKIPYPLYDDILYLVDGITATGAGAFHAGGSTQSQLDSEPQTQTQSVEPTQFDYGSQAPVTPVAHSRKRMRDERTPINIVDDLTASSPVRPTRKRARAASSSPNEGGRSGRKGRKRNADSVSDLASSMREIAGSLKVVSSPEIRDRAVKQMEDDGDFSGDEGVNIMLLFKDDSSIAQTYLASHKKERRTAFLERCLRKAERDGQL